MESAWYNWMPYLIAIILIRLEIRRGCYSGEAMPSNDKLVNFISVFQDSIFIRPLVAYAGAALITLVDPSHAGTLADLPFWPTFFLVLFGQGFFHYWFHRWFHSNPVLWEMHRTHHSATQMSIAVTPRLNMLWEVVIPANWISAAMLYFGMDEVFWAWFGLRSMGNFAPTVIFWDVVFGTAHFPHARQDQVGIADDPVYPWYRQLWWPVFRDTDS